MSAATERLEKAVEAVELARNSGDATVTPHAIDELTEAANAALAEIYQVLRGADPDTWAAVLDAFRNGFPTGVDQYGAPMGDTRTFAERVADLLDQIGSNPCIQLDSGERVFGYFCWWAAEASYDTWVAGRKVVPAPVPDPLPHSMKTQPYDEHAAT